jgi:hypothetical protein
MNLPPVSLGAPGGRGTAGRLVAFVVSGWVLLLFWWSRPSCPLRELGAFWGKSQGTELAVLSAVALVAGFYLHALGVILVFPVVEVTARRVGLWWQRDDAGPSPPPGGEPRLRKLLVGGILDSDRTGVVAARESWVRAVDPTGEIAGDLDLRSAAPSIWTLAAYYMASFPALDEMYRGSALLFDASSALAASLIIAAFLARPGLRVYAGGWAVAAVALVLFHGRRVIFILGRIAAVGFRMDASRKEKGAPAGAT